jgi:hypothetical protein
MDHRKIVISIEYVGEVATNGEVLFFVAIFHLGSNAAVQRPRAALTSAAQVHNKMTRLRRARDAVSRSAATAC